MADAGRLEAIWLKRARRGVMDAVREATVVEGRGLEGDVDRSRRRQETILSREAWSARHFGLLANRIRRDTLPRCRRALNQPRPPPPALSPSLT